jgi:hypothetical protein
MGLCAPEVYRDHFMGADARAVERLGPYTRFHMHTAGYKHFRHVLQIPGLVGLQLTVEANGPWLFDLTPVFREVLEQTRLIVFVNAQVEDLPAVLRQIPHEGLYLMVTDKFVPDQAAYEASSRRTSRGRTRPRSHRGASARRAAAGCQARGWSARGCARPRSPAGR